MFNGEAAAPASPVRQGMSAVVEMRREDVVRLEPRRPGRMVVERDPAAATSPRAVMMSWAEAHCLRSCRAMAAAISSGNRSGVQAKPGMSRAAIRRAFSWP